MTDRQHGHAHAGEHMRAQRAQPQWRPDRMAFGKAEHRRAPARPRCTTGSSTSARSRTPTRPLPSEASVMKPCTANTGDHGRPEARGSEKIRFRCCPGGSSWQERSGRRRRHRKRQCKRAEKRRGGALRLAHGVATIRPGSVSGAVLRWPDERAGPAAPAAQPAPSMPTENRHAPDPRRRLQPCSCPPSPARPMPTKARAMSAWSTAPMTASLHWPPPLPVAMHFREVADRRSTARWRRLGHDAKWPPRVAATTCASASATAAA